MSRSTSTPHNRPISGWRDPFGSHWLGLWLADRHDRQTKLSSRRVARRGWLKPLGEQGKVVWVMAGATRDSVHQAIELLRAIRARRLDIRLVLTFEHEYADLLTALDDCDKTGWGYAPADQPKALQRAMHRLNPYGLIVVNTHIRPNLHRLLDQHPRVLATYTSVTPEFCHEHIGNHADLQTILTQAQVDPNFKSLMNQGMERHLWWLHDDDPARSSRIAHDWLNRYPQDVILVSGAAPIAEHQPISQWNRQPPAGGQILWLDEDKWLPAVAASVTGAHFSQHDTTLLWQAMACGAAISLSAPALSLPGITHGQLTTDRSAINCWEKWRSQPIAARQAGDLARRLFWQQRRLAETDVHTLVERVFEW